MLPICRSGERGRWAVQPNLGPGADPPPAVLDCHGLGQDVLRTTFPDISLVCR